MLFRSLHVLDNAVAAFIVKVYVDIRHGYTLRVEESLEQEVVPDNKPWPSFLDGVGNGLGYAMILVIVGAVREFLGRGSLLGFQIIPDACYDFGYVNNGMMTMPAMALILVGCVIWVHRAYFYKEK